MLTTIFKEYAAFCGELNARENGSLTAFSQGQVTAYALESAQNRGRLMVQPGDDVYEDQVRLLSKPATSHMIKSSAKCLPAMMAPGSRFVKPL